MKNTKYLYFDVLYYFSRTSNDRMIKTLDFQITGNIKNIFQINSNYIYIINHLSNILKALLNISSYNTYLQNLTNCVLQNVL